MLGCVNPESLNKKESERNIGVKTDIKNDDLYLALDLDETLISFKYVITKLISYT